MKYRISNYKKNGSVLLACEADKDLDFLIINKGVLLACGANRDFRFLIIKKMNGSVLLACEAIMEYGYLTHDDIWEN